MGSLFEGTPQQAPSYTSSSTETPQWLQDAIYNQINWSQNVANMPYEPYSGQLVAGAQPQQTSAWNAVTGAQGAYSPYTTGALQGLQQLSGAQGSEFAAAPYFQQAMAANPYLAGYGSLSAQSNLLGQLNYNQPANSLNPYVQQSLATSGVGAASPYLQQQAQAIKGLNYYGGIDRLAPYATASANMSGVKAAEPYLQQAAMGAMGAGAPVTSQISSYMNPYNDAVTGRIAELGARNLQENLAPALGSQFIRAGQFGSRGMGEMGARTLRDLNESVMAQQNQTLQQGYGQALSAAQTDAARQLQASGQIANIGGQVGGLTQAQQQAILQSGQAMSGAEQAGLQSMMSGAGQLGQIGGQLGSLTNAQQQAILQGGQALTSAQQQALAQALAGASQYGQLGQTLGGLTGQQQQAMLTAAQQAGSMRSTDLQRQQSILAQIAQQAQQAQQMGYTDIAALEAAGQSQQQIEQNRLNALYQQYLYGVQYPQQQLNFLSAQIRGLAPYAPTSTTQQGYTTTFAQSPLSQLASGLAAGAGIYKLATG